MEEALTVKTPDGSFSCYLARPAAPGVYPVVVILQEIFGVNAGIRSIAQSYAEKGYIAIAPDLFWRSEPGLSMSEANPADWTKGFALYKTYDFQKGPQDIAAAVSAARTLPGASGKVGVTGYCLGGLLTYLTAARSRCDAFVSYYGAATDQYLDEAKNIVDPLLYHLAEEDEYMDKKAQAAIKAALAANEKTVAYSYSGQNHAFARPGGNHFDAAAAALANERTSTFFERHLK